MGVRIPIAVWRRWRLWKISRYSKIALASSIRVLHRLRSNSSTCIRAQNDSIVALSKQSPTIPMDGTRPDSRARWVNAQEVNWVPWSECITVPGSGWRFPIAIPNAEVTSPEVAELSIDQPTTRRLNTSSTTAQYTLRLPGGMLCDIGHPQLVRFETGEVAVNQVHWRVHRAGPPSGTSVTY